METFCKDIVDFHEKFKREYNGSPRSLTDKEFLFRFNALLEELMEYYDARNKNKLDKEFDALIDLVYFALGTAYQQGLDFKEGWKRVHAANMKKIPAKTDSDSKRGSSLDIVKPINWEEPDLRDLVTKNKDWPTDY